MSPLPVAEWREREELVGSAHRFLREYEAGERPDADPEMVRLARVIVENGDRSSWSAARDPELRRMLRELRDLRRAHHIEGLTEDEAERERALWDRFHEATGTADAVIDDAAEKLANLRAEKLLDT